MTPDASPLRPTLRRSEILSRRVTLLSAYYCAPAATIHSLPTLLLERPPLTFPSAEVEIRGGPPPFPSLSISALPDSLEGGRMF